MNSTVHAFTGDASILANCLRAKLAQGLNLEAAKPAAFKVATCREFGTQEQDAAHMAAAVALIQPEAPAPSMTEEQLIELFANWTVLNGFGDDCGDAFEMQMDDDLTAEQRAWLVTFCSSWDVMRDVEAGRGGVEVGRLQLGPKDFCRVVSIRQHGSKVFTVTNWQQCDDEESNSRTQRYASVADAYARAAAIMADEVADICDTLEG